MLAKAHLHAQPRLSPARGLERSRSARVARRDSPCRSFARTSSRLGCRPLTPSGPVSRPRWTAGYKGGLAPLRATNGDDGPTPEGDTHDDGPVPIVGESRSSSWNERSRCRCTAFFSTDPTASAPVWRVEDCLRLRLTPIIDAADGPGKDAGCTGVGSGVPAAPLGLLTGLPALELAGGALPGAWAAAVEAGSAGGGGVRRRGAVAAAPAGAAAAVDGTGGAAARIMVVGAPRLLCPEQRARPEAGGRQQQAPPCRPCQANLLYTAGKVWGRSSSLQGWSAWPAAHQQHEQTSKERKQGAHLGHLATICPRLNAHTCPAARMPDLHWHQHPMLRCSSFMHAVRLAPACMTRAHMTVGHQPPQHPLAPVRRCTWHRCLAGTAGTTRFALQVHGFQHAPKVVERQGCIIAHAYAYCWATATVAYANPQ